MTEGVNENFSSNQVMNIVLGTDVFTHQKGMNGANSRMASEDLVRHVVGLEPEDLVSDEARLVTAAYLIRKNHELSYLPLQDFMDLAENKESRTADEVVESFNARWAHQVKYYNAPEVFRVQPISDRAQEFSAAYFVKVSIQSKDPNLSDEFFLGRLEECKKVRETLLPSKPGEAYRTQYKGARFEAAHI